MKTLLLFLIPLLSLAQPPKEIDIVKVYEKVLDMGYRSEQIFEVLKKEYEKRNDTIKLEQLKIIRDETDSKEQLDKSNNRTLGGIGSNRHRRARGFNSRRFCGRTMDKVWHCLPAYNFWNVRL